MLYYQLFIGEPEDLDKTEILWRGLELKNKDDNIKTFHQELINMFGKNFNIDDITTIQTNKYNFETDGEKIKIKLKNKNCQKYNFCNSHMNINISLSEGHDVSDVWVIYYSVSDDLIFNSLLIPQNIEMTYRRNL